MARARTHRTSNELIYGLAIDRDDDVDPEACLPMPAGYRWPENGNARDAAARAMLALSRGRNCYLWGPPGVGKDAIVHAYSARFRRPGMALTFRPGSDLAPWFYSRRIDATGTSWQYGHLWRALTEGLPARDGRARPALVLLSDVDRADPAQLEWFRLLADSIEGRVLGPEGRTVPVLPGTQFVCTANSCGSGDTRGRLVSSQPMDASILDRLGRMIEFPYMEWQDERAVLEASYPSLASAAPRMLDALGRAVEALRKAIRTDTLAAEFTHRSLRTILDECLDLFETGTGHTELLGRGFRAWLDGLEGETRLSAARLIDPHVGGRLLESVGRR